MNDLKETTLQLLKEDHARCSDAEKRIWATLVNTWSLSAGVILTAFVTLHTNSEKIPSAAAIYALLPVIIGCWYIQLDLQGKECFFRIQYLMILERAMARLSQLPVPCSNSRFNPILYGTKRHQLSTVFIALPLFVVYIVSSGYGVTFLAGCTHLPEIANWVLLLSPAAVALIVGFRNESAIRKQLKELEDELMAKVEDLLKREPS